MSNKLKVIKKSEPIEEDLVVPLSLEDEITALRQELELFKRDALYSLWFAVNKKNNELADSLNSFTLDVQAKDKSVERYLTLQKGLKDTFETLQWLRNDYLKITEDEAVEAKERELPPIEKHNANRRKK